MNRWDQFTRRLEDILALLCIVLIMSIPSSRASLHRIEFISRGNLIVDGQQIDAPFTMARSKGTFLVNGKAVELGPNAELRTYPAPVMSALSRLQVQLYAQGEALARKGASDAAIAESAANLLRGSHLVHSVHVANSRTIVYRETPTSQAVLMDLTRWTPSPGEALDSRIGLIQRVLDDDGMVIIGPGFVTRVPAERVPQVRAEMENLRHGIDLSRAQRLLPEPAAQMFARERFKRTERP